MQVADNNTHHAHYFDFRDQCKVFHIPMVFRVDGTFCPDLSGPMGDCRSKMVIRYAPHHYTDRTASLASYLELGVTDEEFANAKNYWMATDENGVLRLCHRFEIDGCSYTRPDKDGHDITTDANMGVDENKKPLFAGTSQFVAVYAVQKKDSGDMIVFAYGHSKLTTKTRDGRLKNFCYDDNDHRVKIENRDWVRPSDKQADGGHPFRDNRGVPLPFDKLSEGQKAEYLKEENWGRPYFDDAFMNVQFTDVPRTKPATLAEFQGHIEIQPQIGHFADVNEGQIFKVNAGNVEVTPLKDLTADN